MSFYMGGEGRRLFGQTTPSELKDKFQMSVRMPIGIVGVITPWNFPIAIPSWKTLPALVAGNTIVFKPATDTPAARPALRRAARRGGLPAGVLNVVHGGGGQVGEALVRHPDVRVISLTGSRETGVAVLKAAAEGLKHVHLELGGKNAIIVLDDADLDLAVEGIVWSAFGTSGQRCRRCEPGDRPAQRLRGAAAKLVTAAERLQLGAGGRRTRRRPVITGARWRRSTRYTGIGEDEGAKLLTGGEAVSENGLGKGFYYRPTIFGDVEPGMRIAQEEIFGPTTALIPVESFDEAVGAANGVKYGLSSSIFTRDVNKAPGRCATSTPGSRTSTPARSAPRCICRSAGRRTRATAIARPARRRSTCSPSGSRSTSTTPAACRRLRSTPPMP